MGRLSTLDDGHGHLLAGGGVLVINDNNIAIGLDGPVMDHMVHNFTRQHIVQFLVAFWRVNKVENASLLPQVSRIWVVLLHFFLLQAFIFASPASCAPRGKKKAQLAGEDFFPLPILQTSTLEIQTQMAEETNTRIVVPRGMTGLEIGKLYLKWIRDGTLIVMHSLYKPYHIVAEELHEYRANIRLDAEVVTTRSDVELEIADMVFLHMRLMLFLEGNKEEVVEEVGVTSWRERLAISTSAIANATSDYAIIISEGRSRGLWE